ncbi:unnamed protein product [Symbiodinium sp. CCMP2592]|nr:unnamed protein product [Symbiodinium sp. CCMP2592]
MAYLFNPPKRCSTEWETEDTLGEVPAGHAAEGLLRARSRGQAAAETDCRDRRCKLLFRSQRETAWAKVRQKMRKETSCAGANSFLSPTQMGPADCNSHIAQYLMAWYGLASTSLA